jgi:hypothetical protein
MASSDMGDKGPRGGVDDVFAAVDRVTQAAGAVAGKAPQFGPLGARRVSRSAGWSVALWLVLFFVARFALELEGLSTTVRVLIALLPLPAFAWFLWAFVTSIGEADELERRIQLEALAVAFPFTLLLVMTLGLLQIAIPLSPDDWSYRHIWPLIYVFYLVGLMRARKRYL